MEQETEFSGGILSEVSDLIAHRQKKLELLREKGINPYSYSFDRTYLTAEIIEQFEALESSQIKVRTAGRLTGMRPHGKSFFGDIQDESGKIQIYIKKDTVGEDWYEAIDLWDLGDFVGVEGGVFRTRMGEITINVEKFEFLSKSIRPLPVVKEKIEDGKRVVFDAFSDKEQRYRQRYVDLIVNPDVRDVFRTRSKIINSIREYLNNQDFLEVETPILLPSYGGAHARPFRTHHHALDIDLYLRISLELPLKRLIVGGLEKVYELSKVFRNEGMDRTHNPEFTMLEVYQAYADFGDMMALTEGMFERIALSVKDTTVINYQGTEIDLKAPWKRIKMVDALKEFLDIDVEEMADNQLKALLKKNAIEFDGEFRRGMAINALFEELVTPKIVQPTFVTNYPRETTPLCKLDRANPMYIERFEPFILGWEMGNAYSELNDPILQRQLLEEQAEGRVIDDETPPMDEDFIQALEYGFPPTGGLGIGIDRVVMLLTNQTSIRDVIFFPQMRPE